MDFNGLYIQVEPTNSRSSPPNTNGWIYNINITINPFSLIWNITPRNSYKLDRHTCFGGSIRTTTLQAVQKIKKAYSAGKSGSWDVRYEDLWDVIDLWVVEAFRFCDAFWWTPRVYFWGNIFGKCPFRGWKQWMIMPRRKGESTTAPVFWLAKTTVFPVDFSQQDKSTNDGKLKPSS